MRRASVSAAEGGARVLVYDRTGRLARQVTAAAARLDPPPVVVSCRRPEALAGQFAGRPVDLLVAGPGLDNPAGLERVRIIREELPALAIVVAADDADALDARALVRTGAIDLVALPTTSDQLTGTLERALRLGGNAAGLRHVDPSSLPVTVADPPGGRVITVASASVGCGKTFLATNLAWFLGNRARRRVCLIDLDLQFGEAWAPLGLRPRSTIVDLIQRASEPDSDLADHLEEFCASDGTGISVLAGPADAAAAGTIAPEDVGRVIDAARTCFDDVVIDTPPTLTAHALVADDRSDELIVMATMDVASIRNMLAFLRTLERARGPRDNTRLVVNKAEGDTGGRNGQILKMFPHGFDATFPYAREVRRSIGAGRPVLATNPTAEISLQMSEALAHLLPPEDDVGPRHPVAPGPARPGPVAGTGWRGLLRPGWSRPG